MTSCLKPRITPQKNAFTHLTAQLKAQSQRVFKARGISVIRCEQCQLGQAVCICAYTPSGSSNCDFILLMHRDEVFKPTNTGRLIASIFNKQTYAFCWDRIEPDPALITLLNDPERNCYILFPKPDNEQPDEPLSRFTSVLPSNPIQNSVSHQKKLTFILLDGTWRQSSRMIRLSRWLDSTRCYSLPDTLNAMGKYAVRKAPQNNQLATAQAAALCLHAAGEKENAELLNMYFDVFNQHYVSIRKNTIPNITSAHEQLLAYKQEAPGIMSSEN